MITKNKSVFQQLHESNEKLRWLGDELPENMPLYKDGGLWQLRSDDMNEVILQQEVHESFLDFLYRCEMYNREEILKP